LSSGLQCCGGVLADFNPLIPIVSVPLFHFTVFGHEFVFSNHMLMITAATILLLVFLPLAGMERRMVPSGFRNLVEAIAVYLREEVARPLLGQYTDRYIYYIWTLFFFILTLNLLSLIPTEQVILLITGKENHYGGAATANIWVTGSLALLTFILTHVLGMWHQGVVHYWKNFAPHVGLLTPFIYFLELISALVKPFALAIRLFANMVAGHTLLATFIGLIFVFKMFTVAGASIGAVLVFSLMEIFVAFLQAYIFVFLSALYIGSSIAPQH
jgi:F-type H+-transporting ATPase subunit a